LNKDSEKGEQRKIRHCKTSINRCDEYLNEFERDMNVDLSERSDESERKVRLFL
jgi:hypothetical protein